MGFVGFSQENDPPITEKSADSLQNNLADKGVVFEEVVYEPVKINPLAPSKAAFYSALLPGLGQIYNKRYWKAPIVWGAIGTGIYFYSLNNSEYNKFRDAFKRRKAGFIDDQFFPQNDGTVIPGSPRFSDSALQDAQESAQENRDLALLVTIALYAFNIIDANVDAHLKQYNVDGRLGIDLKPYMDLNPIDYNPNYGLTLVVKF
ncbi:DUF5683 domain-containing protein [Croceitalea sp. MTPC5]|nr:DUF5683 domain-containing protein [Croceitalea sp. MTPC5]